MALLEFTVLSICWRLPRYNPGISSKRRDNVSALHIPHAYMSS